MAEAVTEIARLGATQENTQHSSPQVPTPIVVPVEPSPPQSVQDGSLSIQQQLFLPSNSELMMLVKQVQQGLAASLPAGLVDGHHHQALLSSFGQEGSVSEVGERKRRNGSSRREGSWHDEPPSATAEKRRKKEEPQAYPLAAANDDGWQWRKYGEKLVRDTPNPRSYYKCSDTSCPAKKTVEVDRDGNMINTEYKGEHNHGQPTHARSVPKAASRQPRAKKQASQAQDIPSNASTATDVSRPWSHSPSGAVAGAPAAAKDESHTSPMKGQRRPTNPAPKSNRRQQQQQQPQQPQQEQGQQELQQQQQDQQGQPSAHSAPHLVPSDPASSASALGTATQLVPVGGSDLQEMLKAAGLHISGPPGTAAVGDAGSTLVGADLSNWLKRTGGREPRSSSGSGGGGSAPTPGGLVGLDDLSGWLKQQQASVPASRKGGAGRARGAAQEGGSSASGEGRRGPVAKQQQQQQQQHHQCTPKAGGGLQLGGPFAQVLDSAALGSPPTLLRTVPRHLHPDDGLHDPTRDLQGLGTLCSPPTLLRGSAPEPLQPPLPLHNTCGSGSTHMGLDALHHSLAGGGPLGSASGYLGGGLGGLGSPPTLEGLGSMLKTGGGFMAGGEPASLHSLLCGTASPAAIPPSAFRNRSSLHASFSPHRCDLAAFNSPHAGLPASTPFAPHQPPSRLGEPGRASVVGADANTSTMPNSQKAQHTQQRPQQAQQAQQGQQQHRPGGEEDAEGDAPHGSLGGLCSTPCMGLLPCGTPGTLLPGSCYGGLHGLDGGSLHAHALVSPPSCLPGSSSRAAAMAVGACDNPWGAVLMGALCSPGGGLVPPPTIPRSHGKDDVCARERIGGAAAALGGSSDAAQPLVSSQRISAGAGANADGGSSAVGANQGQQQQQQPDAAPAAAGAAATDAIAAAASQGAGGAPQVANFMQGRGARSSRARAGTSRERAPRTTAAGRAASATTQRSQRQQQQQQVLPGSVPAMLPTCRSPRLDVLAVCAGLAGEVSDQPTNPAFAPHHTAHGPATSHTTNSASTQPACDPSSTTSSDDTAGAASAQDVSASGVATAVGLEGGKLHERCGARRTRVGTRAHQQQQQQQHEQQQQQQQEQQQQQQQRDKKRAHADKEGQTVAGAPVPRDTRTAAAGKSKAARTNNTAEGNDEARAEPAHQKAAPATAQPGPANFAIGDGFAVIKLSGPTQKGPLSMPEGDGFVSIRLGGGPQAGEGDGCSGQKEASSPLKALPAAAPPLNGSDRLQQQHELQQHHHTAAAAGDGGVKAQLVDAFGQVATKEDAGPAGSSRGSNVQRGSRCETQ